MSKRNTRRSQEAGGNTTGWLTTFNDLVTLLMVFFVLLFTMSTIDTKKMKDFQYALQSGLGILKEGAKVSITVKESQPIPDMSHIFTQAEGTMDPAKQKMREHAIEQALEAITSDPGINVRYSKHGARISYEDGLLFDVGKAGINPAGFSYLNKMAALIRKIPNAVRVEGHTDNVPIHTQQFASNWELSIARAVRVVKYFAEVAKINPKRLSAVGYGESRPVAANDTPAGRTQNRRVEIVLVTEAERSDVE